MARSKPISFRFSQEIFEKLQKEDNATEIVEKALRLYYESAEDSIEKEASVMGELFARGFRDGMMKVFNEE